ncbi:MAG TPA: hypothetical protein VGM23_01325, partial [Armatimonadota bacterium]
TLAEGKAVKLTGWPTTMRNTPIFLARDLTLDGKTYAFRNEKGNQLWSQFLGCPSVTLEGTVKDLTVPEPTAANPIPPERQVPPIIKFTLVTDKESILVEVGPQPLLTRLGLTLANDAKVKLTGWKVTERQRRNQPAAVASHIVIQEITVNGTTYKLRDADGKEIAPKEREHTGGGHRNK